MAVHIRLRRMGKKKQPFYRIVAIDSRVARDGKYLDNIGTYNPRLEPAAVQLNSERVVYWLSKVPNLLIQFAACCAGRAF